MDKTNGMSSIGMKTCSGSLAVIKRTIGDIITPFRDSQNATEKAMSPKGRPGVISRPGQWAVFHAQVVERGGGKSFVNL